MQYRDQIVPPTVDKLADLNDPLAVPADPAPIGRLTQLPCPCCGEPSANVSVNLWLLGDDAEEAFTCQECDTGFSVGQVRNFLAVWGKMLNWLAAVPKLD